jgi:hypothetical protein
MLQTATFLDQMIERFRHRWATNPQYRAAFSGVVGLVTLIALCSCAGIVSSVTNSVLASSGFTSSNGVGPLSSGGPQVFGASKFPTETLPAWQAGQVPAGPPIPNSGTPYPSPTKPATPTEQPSPTGQTGGGGGGGGGNLPTTCNGTTAGVSWNISPCPQIAGQSAVMNISAPGHGLQNINVILAYACSSCAFDWSAANYALDSSGNISFPFTVPAKAKVPNAPVSGEININNNQVSFSYLSAPCQ